MDFKSVSINRRERATIISKIREQYIKLAKLKHPNPNFHKEISKTLFKQHLNKLAEIVTPETLPYLHCIRLSAFPSTIISIELAQVKFDLLDTDMIFGYALTRSVSRLSSFEINEIVTPPIFDSIKKRGFIPFPFAQWSLSNDQEEPLFDEELVNSIDNYNTQMKQVYSTLSKQLEGLIATIETCKSTKMFEKVLPNLISLYPESVLTKIRDKNNTIDEELTDEQQNLLDATASLAAAALLEDTK